MSSTLRLADTRKIGGILVKRRWDFFCRRVDSNNNQLDFLRYLKLLQCSGCGDLCGCDVDNCFQNRSFTFLHLLVCSTMESASLWNYHSGTIQKSTQCLENFLKQILMGIIQGVTDDGRITVLLENDLATFEIKEIQIFVLIFRNYFHGTIKFQKLNFTDWTFDHHGHHHLGRAFKMQLNLKNFQKHLSISKVKGSLCRWRHYTTFRAGTFLSFFSFISKRCFELE
jgi:hypothetical protein